MGKRSDFKRLPRDFYKTPAAAVKPLVPHLQDVQSFCEPCAGDGALIKTLIDAGLTCSAAYDIYPMSIEIECLDALDLSEPHLGRTDVIITNPPWDRKILHPMIETFSNLRPTWLLFDSDWVHTKQAMQFLPRLRRIVSVGRVKWFDNTTGKDNCSWHLFDRHDPTITTKFYGRMK